MNLSEFQRGIVALGYRCKAGNDIPESIAPPVPHQMYCWRRPERRGAEQTIQVYANERDIVQKLDLRMVPGNRMITTDEATQWLVEPASIFVNEPASTQVRDWIAQRVKANKTYAADDIGPYRLTMMCEYDVPALVVEFATPGTRAGH